MIEFASPWAFTLLVLPLAVHYLLPAYKEARSSVQVPFFQRLVEVSGESPQPQATVLSRRLTQRLCLVIGWICLVSAAAEPEWVGEPVEVEKSARDLMIAVDLSGSMATEDFQADNNTLINRLDAAKQVLDDFVDKRQGDRLGLILFGDAPYLQVPFTDDRLVWKALLAESQIGMAGQSTVFGDAIGLTIKTFQGSNSQNRVLIILTDGNDTGSRVPPVDAAKIAQAHQVKVYTVAMGDPETTGEEALDIEVLQQVAQITGGAYFEALDQQALRSAYEAIDQLEPELYESFSYRPRQSLFHYPLALLAGLYLIALPLFAVTGQNRRRSASSV